MFNAIAPVSPPAYSLPSGSNMIPARLFGPAAPTRMPAPIRINQTPRQLAARMRTPARKTDFVNRPQWRYEPRDKTVQREARIRRAVIDSVPGDHVLPPLSAESPNQMPRKSRDMRGIDAGTPPRRATPDLLARMLDQLNHCRPGVLTPDESDPCHTRRILQTATRNPGALPIVAPHPDHAPHEKHLHGSEGFRHVHLPRLLRHMQRQLATLQSIMENGCAALSQGTATAPQRAGAQAGDDTDASGFVSEKPARTVKRPGEEEMREWLRNAPDQHALTGFGIFDGSNENPPERPATPHHQD